jgi:thiamine pyrophosphokinase
MTDICSGVSIGGAKWPLEDVTLERRLPWTVSNEPRPGEEKIFMTAECEDGVMGFYWRFEK